MSELKNGENSTSPEPNFPPFPDFPNFMPTIIHTGWIASIAEDEFIANILVDEPENELPYVKMKFKLSDVAASDQSKLRTGLLLRVASGFVSEPYVKSDIRLDFAADENYQKQVDNMLKTIKHLP